MSRFATLCAIPFAVLVTTSVSASAQSRVQTGVLECRGAGAASYVVGSTRQLVCVFRSDYGAQYRYYAMIRRVGLDIGYTNGSVLGWAVLAPTGRVGPGDLEGNYGGFSAGVAVGIGANAHALVGGSGNSFALQPLSLEGQQGVNLAAGVAGLELRYADHGPYKKVRKAHAHHAQR